MSDCRMCYHPNEAGALRCEHCGEPLAVPDKQPEPVHEPTGVADDGDPFRTSAQLGLRAPGDVAVAPRDGAPVLLGRDPSSPICALCSDNVSRQHASIRLTGGVLTITDHDSANGTFVNGQRIDAHRERPLIAGDRVALATDPPLAMTVALLDLPECPR